MSQNIIEFLNKYNILWEPIALNKKKPVKIGNFKANPDDYHLLDRSIIIERQKTPSEYIAIFTNEINQYDVDVKGFKIDDKFKNLPYFESVTKKLPHYFLIVENTTKNRHTAMGADILCSQWSYCKRDTIVYNCNENIKNFKLEDFEKRIELSKFKNVIKKLKENIDSYDYDTWLNICFGIFNTATENMFSNPINFVIDFSKDGKKYDEKAVNTINNLKYDCNGIKFGTLCQYADGKVIENKRIKKNNNNKKEYVKIDCNIKNDEYDTWKNEWEKYVFSIKTKNLVCHDKYKDIGIIEANYSINGTYFINDNNFLNLVLRTYKIENTEIQCLKRWNIDPNKREYMDFIFAPYPFEMNNDYNYYNTWHDFWAVNYKPIENINKEHCIKVYEDFKRHLSKNNDIVYDYLIQMDAHTAQFPGEKIGVGTIICGDSGSGKGTETLLQEAIFGSEYVYQTSDISQVLGQFTSSISNKLIVVLDEAVPKNMFDKDGPLKHLITEKTIKIEKKGKDSYQQNSFCRIIITSNSDNVVKISNSDRRMFVISPNVYITKEYEQFPKNIFDLIHSKDACHIIFNYLRNIKVKYRNIQEWQYNRPLTEEYERMRENSIPIFIQFLIHFIAEYEVNKLEFIIPQISLYEYFKEYISENSKYELTSNAFYKNIGKYCKSINKRRTYTASTSYTEYIINRLNFNAEMARLNYKISDV